MTDLFTATVTFPIPLGFGQSVNRICTCTNLRGAEPKPALPLLFTQYQIFQSPFKAASFFFFLFIIVSRMFFHSINNIRTAPTYPFST